MKRSEKAMNLFKQGYNCSQSVLLSFVEDLDIAEEAAAKISAPFGGGMGRLREVCGVVSGAFMVLGLKYSGANPNDIENKEEVYRIVQKLADDFKKESGSIICRELLNLPDGADNPVPAKRTNEYYKKRPCIEFVGRCVELLEKVISEKENK